MYYQNYEDYIRKVLGYPIALTNKQDKDTYKDEIDTLYPDIYIKLQEIINSQSININSKFLKIDIENVVEAVYGNLKINKNMIITNKLLKDLIKIIIIDKIKEEQRYKRQNIKNLNINAIPKDRNQENDIVSNYYNNMNKYIRF